jgi:type I restriction enzyme S subunit
MSVTWPTVSFVDLTRLERRPVEVVADRQYQEIGTYSYGRGIFHKQARSGLEVGNKDLFLLREGDLILQVTFAWEGAIAICSKAEDGLYGSVRYPTFRVNSAKCFAPFLLKYLCTRQGLEQIGRICPGSAGRNRVLAMKRLSEVIIPLPPLDEQRRIVASIEALAAKADESRMLRELSLDATEALATTAAARVLDDLTGTAPRRPLRSIVALRGGGTPSKDTPHFWGGRIPWITPKDMKRRELSDAIDHITEAATLDSPAKKIAPGAVLVVVRGMILAHTFPAALLRAPAAINQDMKALIPDQRVLPEYLCSVLWAWNPRILELVDRSGHDTRKLNTAKLLAFEVPVPSIPVQERVIAELNLLQAKVDAVKALQTDTAAELDAMLPAILDKAFKGEL